MASQSHKKIEITDGSSIAVIGGGPSGSYFSYFALEFASRYDLDITLDIYEAKNFSKIGAGGCNHCGGIVSESLVQKLATNGIVIPSDIIQRGISTYTLHIEQGKAVLDTPSHEQRIASVFRGGGPKGCSDNSYSSFDNFLLGLCKKKGANIYLERISKIERAIDGIVVHTRNRSKKKYDLIVGAVGLNTKALAMFKTICPEYIVPKITRTYISEFLIDRDKVDVNFGNSMHVFLMNLPNITFGALIPKGDYVTLVLLGKDIDKEIVENFISSEQVKGSFPKNLKLRDAAPCKCYPYINVKAAKKPYADRVVLVGDSASSKLYKNGIGAAYITGRAAAKTAIFDGISQKSFMKTYRPVCRDLDLDNSVGKLIFFATKIIQRSNVLKAGLLHMVIQEQKKEVDRRYMSAVLWDTFTGSAGYRNILLRFLNPKLLINFLGSIINANLTGKNIRYNEKQETGTTL